MRAGMASDVYMVSVAVCNISKVTIVQRKEMKIKGGTSIPTITSNFFPSIAGEGLPLAQ